ncbi:hypothetical protein K8R61_01780, partial [bacterium]|nr:hypothetical protein [bacterium]
MRKNLNTLLTIALIISATLFINLNSVIARDVSGVIIDDTWNTGEQIHVIENLIIGNLIIKPGVNIYIDGYYGIEVQGILNAQGTKLSTIIFEPIDTATGWKGIKFENTVNGSILKWCEFKNAYGFGAIQLLQSYPSINNCLFEANQSVSSVYGAEYTLYHLGGAIFANIENQDLKIENCVFRNNKAEIFGGAISANSLSTGKLILKNNQLIDNQAGHGSLRQNASGGAVSVKGNSQFIGNYFSNNRVIAYTIYTRHGRYTKGGAIYTEQGLCEIIGNGFLDNGCAMTAHGQTPDPSFAFGGAIYQTSGEMIIKNSQLAQNLLSASRERYYRGSAIYIQETDSTLIENSTVVANINAPAIYIYNTVPKENVELINSIVFFNFDSGLQIEGLLTSSYCNIQGGYETGANIININPVFDYYYQIIAVSPMIDAGNPNSYYNDNFPPGLGTQTNDLGFQGGPEAINCLDYDGDGVADCIEECINNPNKAYPDQCGCEIPDTDTDHDGTADCNDLCPNDPNKTKLGICGCGISDVDTDKDGSLDCEDGCPEDVNKIDPGICGCGISDVDTDNDGIADCNDTCDNSIDTDRDGVDDCNDECPNDPDKTKPGICGCGTSDTDTDGDGIADCNDTCNNLIDSDGDGIDDCSDSCPNDSNKTEPGTCGCGTSDTDTDRDGIADCNDACDNSIDTDGDGIDDCNDGCPNDPNKTKPGICGCGTSDTDTDKDGTPDCYDLCPNDPGKTKPGSCGCGVSDTDSDKDEIPDCNDDYDDSKEEKSKNGCFIRS